MPYRILHFIDTLGAGGAERQLMYLLENLDQERYESHVLTTYDTFRHYESELERLGIPLYSLHHGDLYVANRARAVGRYIRLMWQIHPQIVHGWLHYPNLIARTARPVCPPHRLITAIRTEYTSRQRRVEKITSKLSDFRIVIDKDQLSVNADSNTTTIPNGIDLDRFTQNISAETHLSFTLLMVARIDPRKDHQTLLEALHNIQTELPDYFKLLLLGEITDIHTQHQLSATIEKYHLNKLIQQIPPINNIENYYHAADLTVLTSKSEGFPNVVLESFAASKPIIVSDAANKSGLVQDGSNGWVFPTGDYQALAQCLREAWKTPYERRMLMGRRGLEVATQFSVANMVERYTQLYERVLSDS